MMTDREDGYTLTCTHTSRNTHSPTDPYPDADGEVQKEVSGYHDDVREAEGLRQGVVFAGGVRHLQGSHLASEEPTSENHTSKVRQETHTQPWLQGAVCADLQAVPEAPSVLDVSVKRVDGCLN